LTAFDVRLMVLAKKLSHTLELAFLLKFPVLLIKISAGQENNNLIETNQIFIYYLLNIFSLIFVKRCAL